MNRLEGIHHPTCWPRQFSEKVTAHSENLGWNGLRAFACDFRPSQHPLYVPTDTEFMTLEMNTARSSSISYQFGDKDSANLCWQPGDILIYPNAEPSQWEWDNSHSTVVLFLSYSRLKQMIMEGRAPTYRHPVLIPGVSRHDSRLRNLLLMIVEEMEAEHPNGPQFIASLVDATLIHLIKNHITEDNDYFEGQYLLSASHLESIRAFVSDRLHKSISVADLADAAGVKLPEFPRAFRATTGTTPYQYVLRERIKWSEELLKTTELSLVEIAYMTGFSSQSHFARTFRKQKSVTPLKYRRTFA